MKAARVPRSPAGAAADLARLTEIVEQFPRLTIALLGDFVADEFQRGDIARVSREAPVLILRHRETQLLPGGGANAANNLADLGASVRPVSIVGNDAAGRALLEYFRRRHVKTSGIISLRGWTTPVKTRFLAGWAHTVPQQVLRIDRQSSAPLPSAAHGLLKQKLGAAMRGGGHLLVSDYGFGVVTPELVREATAQARWKPVVTLDSRFAEPPSPPPHRTKLNLRRSITPRSDSILKLSNAARGRLLTKCGFARLSSLGERMAWRCSSAASRPFSFPYSAMSKPLTLPEQEIR